MIVDQRFADGKLDGRAVGQRIWLPHPGGASQPYEIIGVVNSILPLSVGAKILPTFYTPLGGLRYLEGKLIEGRPEQPLRRSRKRRPTSMPR